MAFELRQQLKLQQKLMMTQQLQQAIRLLQLSRLELVETVHQELLENPYLEEKLPERVEEAPSSEDIREGDRKDSVYEDESSRNADWEDYLGDFASAPKDYQQREIQEEEENTSRRQPLRATCSGSCIFPA